MPERRRLASGGPFAEACSVGTVTQGRRRGGVPSILAVYTAGPGGVLSGTGGQLGGEGIAGFNQFGLASRSKR